MADVKVPGPGSQGKPFRVITVADAVEAKFEEIIRMNCRHQINLNPKILGKLGATVKGGFQYVEYGDLDEAGAEVAMAVASADSEGKVQLDYAKNQRTAQTSLYRVIAKYPAYRVEKGYLREIKVTSRTEGGISFLVLNLKGSVVVPVEKKKKDDAKAQGTTEKKDKKPTTSPTTTPVVKVDPSQAPATGGATDSVANPVTAPATPVVSGEQAQKESAAGSEQSPK